MLFAVKPFRNLALLIVEPNRDLQEHLSENFRQYGFGVYTCEDVQGALRFLRMNIVSVDIILGNVEISKETGFVLLKSFCASESHGPLFVMTPSSRLTDVQMENLCKRILRSVPT